MIINKLLRKAATLLTLNRSKNHEVMSDSNIQPFKELWLSDLDEMDINTISLIKKLDLSMTSVNNLAATAIACKYIVSNKIPGDFMECGVWRGGHSILAAHYLLHSRKVYMLDTFKGMGPPLEIDKRIADGVKASAVYNQRRKIDNGVDWCYASINDVKSNFKMFNIDSESMSDSLTFLQGRAEDILLKSETILPDRISVLRLDTDWYQSTKVELEVLWKRISVGGVLIIDDYGYWQGCKQAVDEFFADSKILLLPIDDNARIAVKTS